MKLAEAFFVTKHCIHVAEASLRQALLEPHNKGEAIDTDEEQRVITCLKKVSKISISCLTLLRKQVVSRDVHVNCKRTKSLLYSRRQGHTIDLAMTQQIFCNLFCTSCLF